jgi:hypothetical protein
MPCTDQKIAYLRWQRLADESGQLGQTLQRTEHRPLEQADPAADTGNREGGVTR